MGVDALKVIMSGGGTGGHIYPAVAIAKEIKSRFKDAEIIFVGTENGLENSIIPKEGFELKKIKIRGFKRKITTKNIPAVKEAITSYFEVRKLIKQFKPDLVIGTGGYVCGTVLLAAALMHRPTVIHEQNAFPGVTNKLLSRFVDRVAVNFEEAAAYFPSKEKIVVTGNPIREGLTHISRQEGMAAFGFDPNLPLVFITGGSRGAKKINESIMPLAKTCVETHKFQVLHMTGETQYEGVVAQYKAQAVSLDTPYLKVVPYLHNMPHALAACHLAIGRCGASTLSEITALGKPSILIPFPYATDNHQEYNARALEKNGAAIVILEKDLTEDLLCKQVQRLLDNPETLAKMGSSSKKLGKTEAARIILDEALAILKPQQ